MADKRNDALLSLPYVLVAFRNTFGVEAPIGQKLRWGFEDGRINRKEFEAMLAHFGVDDPGIVGQWLPELLERRRFELQRVAIEPQQQLF